MRDHYVCAKIFSYIYEALAANYDYKFGLDWIISTPLEDLHSMLSHNSHRLCIGCTNYRI